MFWASIVPGFTLRQILAEPGHSSGCDTYCSSMTNYDENPRKNLYVMVRANSIPHDLKTQPTCTIFTRFP